MFVFPPRPIIATDRDRKRLFSPESFETLTNASLHESIIIIIRSKKQERIANMCSRGDFFFLKQSF